MQESSKHILSHHSVWFSPTTPGSYICFNAKAESKKEKQSSSFYFKEKKIIIIEEYKSITTGLPLVAERESSLRLPLLPRGSASPALRREAHLQKRTSDRQTVLHPINITVTPFRPLPLKCARAHSPACKRTDGGVPSHQATSASCQGSMSRVNWW